MDAEITEILQELIIYDERIEISGKMISATNKDGLRIQMELDETNKRKILTYINSEYLHEEENFLKKFKEDGELIDLFVEEDFLYNIEFEYFSKSSQMIKFPFSATIYLEYSDFYHGFFPCF